MAIGISINLYNGASEQASMFGITVLWWDERAPKLFDRPTGRIDVAFTDASGFLTVDLSACSALSVGQVGFLLAYQPDGSNDKNAKLFAGALAVGVVAGGVQLISESSAAILTWRRNWIMSLGASENSGDTGNSPITNPSLSTAINNQFAILSGAL